MSSLFTPLCSAEPLLAAISDRELLRFQEELGIRVPPEFLSFLQEWNGVHFRQELWFPLEDGQDEDDFGTVYRIYGITAERTWQDLRRAGEGYHFSQRVPSRFLAIGDNNNWDRVCISIGPPDYGKVYNWQPGEGWPPEEEVATMDYMHPVADDFSTFWSLLQLLEE